MIDLHRQQNHLGTMHGSTFDRFLRAGQIVAAFAMGGTVAFGIALGWMPVFAGVDVHAIGGIAGGITGLIAHSRHIV